MAHGIVLGVDRMASTSRETIWHNKETEADGRLVIVAHNGDNEATALQMSGVVWPKDADNDIAGTVTIQTTDGVAIDTHVATVSPSGRVLGVVTNGYQAVPFQYLLVEWILALVRAGGIPETLGTYDAGRNMFASLQVADDWHVPGDHSATRMMYNILANNTGERSIVGSMCAFRVVCRNTSLACSRVQDRMGVSAAERVRGAYVSLRHTANVNDRIRDAVEFITKGRERAESEQALMARLAAKVISRAEVERFVSDYISLPADASKRTKSIRENSRESFQAVMSDVQDLGNHALGGSGISAYGLLQSVTRYEDWESSCRPGDQPVATRRAFRAFLGEREIEKATARDRILELAGV